jgi:hypothetical protein
VPSSGEFRTFAIRTLRDGRGLEGSNIHHVADNAADARPQ